MQFINIYQVSRQLLDLKAIHNKAYQVSFFLSINHEHTMTSSLTELDGAAMCSVLSH